MKQSKIVRLSTNAMLPILKEKDNVLVLSKNIKSLNVDDLVVVNINNLKIAKRIIYKDRTTLILKGDQELKSTTLHNPKKLKKIIRLAGKNQPPPEDAYLTQSTIYIDELKKLNKKLSINNVNFLYLKGLPLSLHIISKYPNRLYADCDLLVSQKDWSSFKEIAENLGFVETNSSRMNLPNIFKDKITEVTFIKKIANISVVLDVHAEVVFMMNEVGSLNNLFPDKLLKKITANFLSTRQLIKINNQYFPILSDLNLVFYLGLHIFHHNFRGYNNYFFFDLVYRKLNPDLKKLSSLITHTKTSNYLYPVFKLYQIYYNPTLPESFLQSISNSSNHPYLWKNINIFDSQTRVKEGINRFILLLLLSPYPLSKRLLTLFTPAVLFSVLTVILEVTFSKLSKLKKISTNKPHQDLLASK